MASLNPNASELPPLRWGLAGLRTDEIAPQLRWLWQGYLIPGSVTLLTSQWKTGKTTLTSILLSRMKTGGVLAGLPVSAGRAIVLSEESADQWLLRGQRLDLENQVGWYCRPFRGRPNPRQWQTLLDRVAEDAADRAVSLLVVDPLAAFYPGKSENDAVAMLDALAPLQRLAAHGLAVLALHHPAKKEQGDGPSGRGSGALLACADILLEMRCYRRPTDDDRRRRIFALSRFNETPRELVIELTADGTDYVGAAVSPTRSLPLTGLCWKACSAKPSASSRAKISSPAGPPSSAPTPPPSTAGCAAPWKAVCCVKMVWAGAKTPSATGCPKAKNAGVAIRWP